MIGAPFTKFTFMSGKGDSTFRCRRVAATQSRGIRSKAMAKTHFLWDAVNDNIVQECDESGQVSA